MGYEADSKQLSEMLRCIIEQSRDSANGIAAPHGSG